MTTRSSERTILVVEDQPEIPSLLADALEKPFTLDALVERVSGALCR